MSPRHPKPEDKALLEKLGKVLDEQEREAREAATRRAQEAVRKAVEQQKRGDK